MNEPDFEPLTLPEQRARDAVRRLPIPDADPAYRARLRQEFVAGTLASPFGEVSEPVAELPGALDRSDAARDLPVRGRVVRGPWTILARPLAWAAAAALVAVSIVRLNQGPAWQLGRTVGDGIAVVDTRPIPLEHGAELAAALHPGAVVRVPSGAQIEVLTPGGIMMQLMAGTEVVLPNSPGRWFARSVAARLARGELRITTGASFRGARLALTTPEAHIEVTGTTLAVICEPTGTCVCVLEGHVDVGTSTADMTEVVGGRRRYLFNDGRAPESDEMRGPEREPLGALRRNFETTPRP